MTVAAPALATPAQIVGLLRWSKLIALDLETTGLNPRRDRVRLLTVGDGNRVLTLDCFAHDPRPLLPWLAGKIVVAHHAAFDLGFLWHLGLTDLPEMVCTYLLAQLLTAGEGSGAHGFPPLGLGECVKRWLGKDLAKDLQTSDWSGPLSAEQLAYARADVEVLPPLFGALGAELDQAGLVAASDVELRALRAFVWMAQNGVPFDRDAWKALAVQAEAGLVEVTAELNALAPPRGAADLFGTVPEWNWASPKQVGEVLARLGCPAPSTNDYYLAECRHPIGALLRRHRELAKRLSTYGPDWQAHVAGDGRVYPQWRQFGAASGRTSCSDPNMQQLPRDEDPDTKAAVYKACVRALPGRSLVKADYSQIELRLACKLAREPAMLQAYQRGEDLHTQTARLMLGKHDVTKDDRQIAKSANFGLLYGMGAPGYRAYAKATYGLDLGEEQAERYRGLFFRAYPKLAAWHADTRRLAVRETRTLVGRRRQLPPAAPDTWRLNTPVQGSGADGLKLALALLWERRAECPGAFPVLAVHDEIVVECDEGRAEQAKTWVTEAMLDAMGPIADPVPVAVDAAVKRTWG